MNDLDRYASAIANGEADAFADWLRSAEQPLRLSLRKFAAQLDTEAILQEGLLRVWQVAPRFKPDGRPNGLLRLAHRILRNLCFTELRRRGRTLPPEDSALDAPSPPDPILRNAIQQCRETLPKKPAAALEARVAARGGEADQITATRLRMRKNTFLQNLTRARRLLRSCLERRGVRLGGAT